MMKHVYSVLGYIVASFVTQASSHFLIFKDHYAAVSWMKPEPVFALGFLCMIIQGTVLSVIYSWTKTRVGGVFDAIVVSWLFGGFLVSYIAFGEAAKYAVPSIPSWIGVEILSGLIQFTIAGALLGLAHRHSRVSRT